ncbi:hypothetical protein QW180_19320 [Vibrio sinaloensis]|nr:hypothetical protein [Vibrio sinaloensis]
MWYGKKRFEKRELDSDPQDRLVRARDGKCGITGQGIKPTPERISDKKIEKNYGGRMRSINNTAKGLGLRTEHIELLAHVDKHPDIDFLELAPEKLDEYWRLETRAITRDLK